MATPPSLGLPPHTNLIDHPLICLLAAAESDFLASILNGATTVRADEAGVHS